MKKIFDRDVLGAIASAVCLLHCLCLPWLLAISGAWVSQYLSAPWFHHLMLIMAIMIGAPVFIRAFLKYNSKWVLICGVFGLALTTYGTLQDQPCCPPTTSQSENCAGLSECSSLESLDRKPSGKNR